MTAVALYPLADTASSEGQLISDYIHPYFSNVIHPICMDDFVNIAPGIREFCVVGMEPKDFRIITPETQITLARRLSGRPLDYGSINNVMDCAVELQRDVNYINPKWCAESLAEFTKGLQRLMELLQNPPLYEKAILEC